MTNWFSGIFIIVRCILIAWNHVMSASCHWPCLFWVLLLDRWILMHFSFSLSLSCTTYPWNWQFGTAARVRSRAKPIMWNTNHEQKGSLSKVTEANDSSLAQRKFDPGPESWCSINNKHQRSNIAAAQVEEKKNWATSQVLLWWICKSVINLQIRDKSANLW